MLIKILGILMTPRALLEKYPKLCFLFGIIVALNIYFKWYVFWNSKPIQAITLLIVFGTLLLNKIGVYF